MINGWNMKKTIKKGGKSYKFSQKTIYVYVFFVTNTANECYFLCFFLYNSFVIPKKVSIFASSKRHKKIRKD